MNPRRHVVSGRDTARASAIAQYTADYERHADSAQVYAGTELSATVAGMAVLFLIAADAEAADPKPRDIVDCHCPSCWYYRVMAPKEVPEMERLS